MESPNVSLDLTTPEGVKTYLLQTPFQATDVTVVVGGMGNFTYRVTLKKPFSPPNSSQPPVLNVILKHAEPYAAARRDFPLDVGRQNFEILAYREVSSIVSPTSDVSLPSVYYEDHINHVFIIHDCGESSTTLKEYLKRSPPSVRVARRMGDSLGQFLGKLHVASHQSQPADSPGVLLKEKFSKNIQARHISAYITYGGVKRDLPRTTSRLDDIIALVDSAQEKIKTTNEVLVMGDFWPGNILVHGESMDKLSIVDWELAKPGLAGLDVGQLLAELHTLRKFHPSSQLAVDELISAFITGYKSVVSSLPSNAFDFNETAKIATAHVGAHLFATTPNARPKWGSDEMIAEVTAEGITFLSNVDNDIWRRESFLGRLYE